MLKTTLLKKILLCSAYILGTAASLQATPFEAGPIWNNNHASKVCPSLCAKHNLNWDGNWWTTTEGQMSLCNCLAPLPNPVLQSNKENIDKNIESSPLNPVLEQPQGPSGSEIPDNLSSSVDNLRNNSGAYAFQDPMGDKPIANHEPAPAAVKEDGEAISPLEVSGMVVTEEHQGKEGALITPSGPLIERVENCLIAAKKDQDKYYWSGWMGPLNKQARIAAHSKRVKEDLKEECPAIKQASLETIQEAMGNIENKVARK